jgi:hypothetical protein
MQRAVAGVVPTRVALNSTIAKFGQSQVLRCFSDVALTDEEAEQQSVFASMEEVRRQQNLVCNKPICMINLLFNKLQMIELLTMFLIIDALIPEPADALPADLAECAALDCMPNKQQARTAVIRKMKKNAMSSGTGKTRGWIWHCKNEGEWTNPLTGWSSSADPMVTVKLNFDTKEEAIEFSKKKGMNYEVQEPPERLRSRGTNYYAHNFLPAELETKLRIEGKTTKHFANPNNHKSNYFRPLNFHGTDIARQHGMNQDQPIA